jgi:hypothetical protein
MVELKGHEEKAGFTRPLGARHGVNPGAKTWKELRDEETEQLGLKKLQAFRFCYAGSSAWDAIEFSHQLADTSSLAGCDARDPPSTPIAPGPCSLSRLSIGKVQTQDSRGWARVGPATSGTGCHLMLNVPGRWRP